MVGIRSRHTPETMGQFLSWMHLTPARSSTYFLDLLNIRTCVYTTTRILSKTKLHCPFSFFNKKKEILSRKLKKKRNYWDLKKKLWRVFFQFKNVNSICNLRSSLDEKYASSVQIWCQFFFVLKSCLNGQ